MLILLSTENAVLLPHLKKKKKNSAKQDRNKSTNLIFQIKFDYALKH